MEKDGHTLRVEVDEIEVTRNGLLGGPVDDFRRFVPGMPRYYIDDEQVTAEQYVAFIAERLPPFDGEGM